MSKNVTLFTGGRGNSPLIKALLQRDDIYLTLIINGFDDGLSTGALRRFIPGMLGPSDFRKNIANAILDKSPSAQALKRILEYRFPMCFTAEKFEEFVHTLAESRNDTEVLSGEFGKLDDDVRTFAVEALKRFLEYYAGHPKKEELTFEDCSLGNLIFAGTYLECRDFNKTIARLSEVARIACTILNIDEGKAYTLAAIKASGEVLRDEASIVSSKQSASPIQEIFFIDTNEDIPWDDIEKSENKIDLLGRYSHLPQMNDTIRQNLENADVICFGSGTHFSSLLPSYRIIGPWMQCLADTPKVFIANTLRDHDIKSLYIDDIVQRILSQFGDEQNSRNCISNIIYSNVKHENAFLFRSDPEECFMNAKVLRAEFQNTANAFYHDGKLLTETIYSLCK